MELSQQKAEWRQGFEDGRRHGFAAAALLLALVSFVSLLGMEKALTAIILAVIGLRGAAQGSESRRMGTVAIIIASVFLVSVPVILIMFWDQVVEFVTLLEQLS